jgi:hypothetical protein
MFPPSLSSRALPTHALLVSLAVVATWTTSVTSAQVVLPDGLVVPRDSMGGEVQLHSLFSSRGESIDWISDAARTPDTFSPLCDFSATFVLKQSGSSLGVGWYNVIPDARTAPRLRDIVPIVPAGSPVGTVISGTSIREDPRYLGGLIGFALLRSPPHFSEARWNTVCDSGPCAGTPGPWVLSVSYASSVTPNAWYLAFEDGDTSSSSWNNDGDYNDYVFLFTGLECAGGGEPCVVDGEQGICAAGRTECGPGGALSCRRVNTPREERCDGADSDCDGEVDEGEGLCPGLEVCTAGRCVPPCFEGGCRDGETCSDAGVCIETACVAVDCPVGERCLGGVCDDACAGVVCPGQGSCVAGRCIDLCEGVACPDGVCERGVCVEPCACRACGAGNECDPGGACVPEGCAGVSCDAGETCEAGACRDACVGAVCPAGQRCEAGECVEAPPAPAVALPDAGTPDAAVALPEDASDGAPDSGSRRRRTPASSGCRAGHGSDPTPAGLALALVALALCARRGNSERERVRDTDVTRQ